MYERQHVPQLKSIHSQVILSFILNIYILFNSNKFYIMIQKIWQQLITL